MFLQNSEKKIEEVFEINRKAWSGQRAAEEHLRKLDACDRDLALAMKYLYVTARIVIW